MKISQILKTISKFIRRNKQGVSISTQDLINILIGPDFKASYEQASGKLVVLGDEVIPSLERALHEVSVESQKMPIYMTLKDMKSKTAASVLLSHLPKESNNSFRAIIVQGLGKARYRKAGPLLEQTLDDTQDKHLRWCIQVALAQIGEKDEKYYSYLTWLLEKTEDPNTSVRIKAVKALKEFNTSVAQEKLLEKLQNDEDSAVKALATLSLIGYNPENIQRPLERIKKESPEPSSLFALLVLSRIQKISLPISVQELRERISHWSPRERVTAIRALAWFYPPENGTEILNLLIDYLIMDYDLSVKQEVVGIIERFRLVDATEAITVLQSVVMGKEENDVELLAAVALVKLGHQQYLEIIRKHLINLEESKQDLARSVLFSLDTELQNDFVPFLLDIVDHLPNPNVQEVVRFFLIGKYWRDPRLMPYFRDCLAGRRPQTDILWIAQNLLAYSREGYEPAYNLLKDFLGEEPSEESIKRYFFWLSGSSPGRKKPN